MSMGASGSPLGLDSFQKIDQLEIELLLLILLSDMMCRSLLLTMPGEQIHVPFELCHFSVGIVGSMPSEVATNVL